MSVVLSHSSDADTPITMSMLHYSPYPSGWLVIVFPNALYLVLCYNLQHSSCDLITIVLFQKNVQKNAFFGDASWYGIPVSIIFYVMQTCIRWQQVSLERMW